MKQPQLPEFASPNPATLETVELKLRQLIDYLQAKEDEEKKVTVTPANIDNVFANLKNGLVGKYASSRINGKTYDADDNEVEEEHEADCFCCRAKGAGGNEPVQYGKDCLTGALRCIICNKHYDDCPHKPPYITIPKPEWWKVMPHCQITYLEALEAAGKAIGVEFKLDA